MSTEGGTRAIIAALLANLGIAVTKFVAYLISGSTSMLAESVHSLADSGNQVLLIIGGRRARKAATAEHPFGFGRERYVFAFLVSIILFSVGGVFSIYEGVHKIEHPEPIEVPWLPIAVLLVSIGLESFSLRTALKESAPQRQGISILRFVRRAKAPELPVVVLEDIAALTGLVLALFGVGVAVLTGNGVWDGVGTILMKTLYLGPDELLVAMKVAVSPTRSAAAVAAAINAVEARVRAAVPVARVMYIEPDVYDPDRAAAEGSAGG
jgi:cation diffusion facilitator family transporter